jgi:hypothetical protein
MEGLLLDITRLWERAKEGLNHDHLYATLALLGILKRGDAQKALQNAKHVSPFVRVEGLKCSRGLLWIQGLKGRTTPPMLFAPPYAQLDSTLALQESLCK